MRAASGGLVFAAILTACSSSMLDVGSHPETIITPTSVSGMLFGNRVTVWSTFKPDGTVDEVGVRLPMSAVEAATSSATDTPVLTLAMPERVSGTTFFDHLDIYWARGGDGPTYDNPHFDFHFFRMTVSEVRVLDCSDKTPVPLALLPAGYSAQGVAPECKPQSGWHASPDTDFGVPFSKTMILGFYGGKTTLVEPMLTSDALRARRSFPLRMPQPTSLGGARTRFPKAFEARYDEAGAAYDLVFRDFEIID